MVGGNGSFSYTDNKSSAYLNYKSNVLTASPNLGYFFIDKLAAGAKIAISSSKANYPSSPSTPRYLARTTFFNFGPFVRYYLLNPENAYNLLIEGSYLHQIRKDNNSNVNIISKQSANSYAINAGPVVYFNSGVGIEFTIGFSSLKFENFEGRSNSLSANIGFQIHLEK